jgi:glycosyltransferase involved in cell wall biosynthesis
MKVLGLGNEVDFTGKLPSYNDVIAEVRKAQFALLPLKVDLISGTIREAMANGLPVVTSKTPDTPKLNEARESVLLSDIGDFNAMADNMMKLLSDQNFAQLFRENGAKTVFERYSNKALMLEWRDCYHAILKNER